MEQLITFETAKLAKEAGFDWTCHSMYGNQNNPQLEEYNEMKAFLYSDYVPAPTQSLLQKWLRDEKYFHVVPEFRANSGFYMVYVFDVRSGKGKGSTCYRIGDYQIRRTYEEALEVGLQEALKLVISKNSQGGN